MTDNNHLITPPLELVVKWLIEGQSQHHCTAVEHSINQAARWGADQQLELDATWVDLQTSNKMSADRLRLEMRPVPLSLKEQALKALNQADKGLLNESEWQQCCDTIRCALEMLPNE